MQSSLKSHLVSAALASVVSAFIGALWLAGAFASLEALFLVGAPGSPDVPPQTWVALLLVCAAGIGSGLFVERAGGRRASLFVSGALLLLGAASLLASHFLRLDILFVPMLLAAGGAAFVAQARRLWLVDAALTRGIQRIALHTSALEGGKASARLLSGLKLLDTVLPLAEAVIFRLDEAGAPAPAARQRSAAGGGGAAPPASAADTGAGRNSAWRAGVRLCERAIASGEVLVESGTAGGADGGSHSNVAVPLSHGGRASGVLLVRLREPFDETDRPLLETVSAQFGRNLQREGALALDEPKHGETFYSLPAAAHRLESFGVVSGLLTEQSFAAHVLAETSDGHAVAYLDGTIAYLNRQMIESARLSAKESRAVDLFGLLDRFRTGVFDEPSIAVRRVLQTGQAYERELPFADRGQTLALRIALVKGEVSAKEAQAGAPAQPLCLAVTARDVTRMKEYEKLKSDMISLMSHELRTPITSINGFAELLVMDETVPAEAREFLSIIHTESQRLTRMINTFLSVTKLEQKDRQEVLMAPLMLDDVVRETVTNFQSAAKKKRIRLVEKDALAKLPPVAADRSLITQAVANLVENAIKYSPERTTVMLSTVLEADAVRVVVEDRGYGVPPESVERVWEKFYRVMQDGRGKEEESAGLGLAFVREVVEQHGGRVGLESEIGLGSKFSFTLPRL